MKEKQYTAQSGVQPSHAKTLSIGTLDFASRYTDSYDGVPHSHDFYEIVFILNGSITHCVNKTLLNMKIGNAFIIVPYLTHSYVRSVDCTHRDIMISERLLKEICDFLGMNLFEFIQKNQIVNFSVPSSQIDNLEKIHNLISSVSNNSIKAMLQKTLCCQLLTFLCTDTQEQTFSNDFKNKCLTLINEHYADKNIHQILHNELGFTHGHFCKKFKATFSMSPTDFINIKRINESATILKFSNYTIEKCSLLVGFDSLPYFIKLFKHHFGMTPTQYRHSDESINMADPSRR